MVGNTKAQYLVLFSISAVTSKFLDYGVPCSPNDTENICDPAIFLTCVEDTCLCNETMAWDVKNVSQCSFKVMTTCPRYPAHRGPFCYGTAVCDELWGNPYDGICTCLAPDVPSPIGGYCLHLAREVGEYCTQDGVTCSVKEKLACSGTRCGCQAGWLVNGTVCMAGFNARCKVGSELPTETCRRNTLLTCNEETEKCECTRGIEHVWNEESAMCLTKIGATCEFGDVDHHSCVENSHCRTVQNDGAKICTCNQYYHASPDGMECLLDPAEKILSHGEQCDPDNLVEICNYAKDQLCTCPYQSFTCFCECDAGLLVNSRGDCEAGYKAPCSSLPNPGTNLTCNSEAFMKCRENEGNFTCGCDSPLTQAYNPLSKMCHLLVGQECDVTLNPDKISCHSTSICRTTGGESTYCWCQQNYEPSLDQASCNYNYENQTLLLPGQECEDWNYGEFCPHVWNLICLNGTCQCPEGGFLWSGEHPWEGCYPQEGSLRVRDALQV
ncbi:fibrillin-2 isoform X2 [Folsomia candida]|uniref:fibrillin-2 isoform X2 n=1 Tax=Folsomia candida TaxID=158441 RepID=UPI000B8FAD8C|nr:fibrillin-2 isoform X2 [Folsomia candida]